MTVKFMPSWSWDINKTENKLTQLASEGFLLTGFKKSGKFIFEKGKKEDLKFRIVKEKNYNGKVPKRFTENGWEKCAECKNHYIIKNPDKKTSVAPSYKQWVSYYRKVQATLFLIFSGTLGGILGLVTFFEDTPQSNTILIIILSIIMLFTLIALFIAHNSNKKILSNNTNSVDFDFTIPKENFIYSKEEEKMMLKSKQMIKKSPLFWISAPDKAEKMVEKMAQEGWKFYRFDKLGTEFYFIKSKPCKLRFVVDFQNEISDEYISITKEMGWKLHFASASKVEGYCIWSKEYTDNDNVPELYSDDNTMSDFIKRRFCKMTILSVVAVIIYTSLIILLLTVGEMTPLKIALCIVSFIVIIEYGIFSVKSIISYLKMKKRTKDL